MEQSNVIFVAGQRGSGKSHWVKSYIKGLTRVMVFDTLSEYDNVKPRFADIEGLLDHVEKWQGSSFCEAALDSIRPKEDIELFCRIACAVGNLWVVIEEIDNYCTVHNMPEEMQKLIKYGRHYGVSLIGISRRPAEVNRLFTSQCNRFVVFKQLEGRDVEYWKTQIGEAADHLGELRMKHYHYIDVDFNDPASFDSPLKPPISS